MKIVVNTKELLKALAFVNGALKDSPMYPIVRNVACVLADGKLYLKVTDLATTLITYVDCPINVGKVSFLIPSGGLRDLLVTLADEEVVLNIDESEDNRHVAEWSGGGQKLTGEPFVLFPPRPTFTPVESKTITLDNYDRPAFMTALKETAFACSKNDLQAKLLGVNVASREGFLNFFATNDRICSFRSISFPELDSSLDFIVPKKFIGFMLGVNEIVDSKEEASVTVNKSRMQVRIGRFTLITQLIDEKFMDYYSMFMQAREGLTGSFTVNVDLLESAINRALLTSGVMNFIDVTVDCKTRCLVISSTNDNGDRSTKEAVSLLSLTAEEEVSFTFEGEYFKKVLSNFAASEVTALFGKPGQVFMFQYEEDSLRYFADNLTSIMSLRK